MSLKQDFPQILGAAIIIQTLQRVTTILLFHSYLSCHLPPPSSLVPFLSPGCTVPRYLGNAAVMFCSPFSRHSLALEGRCTLLVLLSSTPKKAHVDGSIKPLFNLHAAWDDCRHPEHKIKCYQMISVFYFLFIFPPGIYLSLYMNLKLHCKDTKPYSEWGLGTSL